MSCVMNLKGNRLLASHFSIGFMKKKRSFRRIFSSISDMELLPGTCSWTLLFTELGCGGWWFLLRFIASISADILKATLKVKPLSLNGCTCVQYVHTSNACKYKFKFFYVAKPSSLSLAPDQEPDLRRISGCCCDSSIRLKGRLQPSSVLLCINALVRAMFIAPSI